MKFKNIIKVLVLIAFAFIAVNFSNSTKVSASRNTDDFHHTLSTYPKAFRGHWYLHVRGNSFSEDKITEKTHYSKIVGGGKSSTLSLHKYSIRAARKLHASWLALTSARKLKGYNWNTEYYWPDPTQMKIYTTAKYKGHDVLVVGDGVGGVLFQEFRSKALARKYKHIKLKHLKYYF